MKNSLDATMREFFACVERTLNSGPSWMRCENFLEAGTDSLRMVTEGYADPSRLTVVQTGIMHAPQGIEEIPESRMVEGDLYQLVGEDSWILLEGAGLRHSLLGPLARLREALEAVEVSPGRWRVRVAGGLVDEELTDAATALRAPTELFSGKGDGPSGAPPEWASVIVESGAVREVRYPDPDPDPDPDARNQALRIVLRLTPGAPRQEVRRPPVE